MFEYKAFEAFTPEELAERLNKLAPEGWRLHTVHPFVVPGAAVGEVIAPSSPRLLAVVERLQRPDDETPEPGTGAMACTG